MPADASNRITRRSFLLAHVPERFSSIRPPWFDDSALHRCTGCSLCVDSCSEQILQLDGNGVPEVVLDGGCCTFCGDCASACDTDVFDLERVKPWETTITLEPGCLMELGISCRLCTDACDSAALLFEPRGGPVGSLQVATANCSGCGACIALCPTEALHLDAGARAAA